MISYYVMDPTKNITILVETPVPEASFPYVAAELMKREPDAEQVGFLQAADASGEADHVERMDAGHVDVAEENNGKLDAGCGCMKEDKPLKGVLRMAGGEFCGNASMSAAVYYAMQAGIAKGETKEVILQVSGAADPVSAQVKRCPDDTYEGCVQMPRPLSVSEEKLPIGNDLDGQEGLYLPVVRFEGIAHVILDEDFCEASSGQTKQGLSEMNEGLSEAIRKQAEAVAPIWCRHLGVEALGLMFLNRMHDAMTPLVYVPAAGTLVWESSCASGTTAVGAYLARLAGDDVSVSLRQPGGVLEIMVAGGDEYLLKGVVAIVESKRIDIQT